MVVTDNDDDQLELNLGSPDALIRGVRAGCVKGVERTELKAGRGSAPAAPFLLPPQARPQHAGFIKMFIIDVQVS